MAEPSKLTSYLALQGDAQKRAQTVVQTDQRKKKQTKKKKKKKKKKQQQQKKKKKISRMHAHYPSYHDLHLLATPGSEIKLG